MRPIEEILDDIENAKTRLKELKTEYATTVATERINEINRDIAEGAYYRAYSPQKKIIRVISIVEEKDDVDKLYLKVEYADHTYGEPMLGDIVKRTIEKYADIVVDDVFYYNYDQNKTPYTVIKVIKAPEGGYVDVYGYRKPEGSILAINYDNRKTTELTVDKFYDNLSDKITVV